jgi:multiple antibiotic resistance protein
MERISFIFTICFMLLGPIKIIQPFARLTQGKERSFKRSVAIKSALIAAIVCVFVVIAGDNLVSKYELSFAALQISGGLVLLLAAMLTIFPRQSPRLIQRKTAQPCRLPLGSQLR